MSKKDRRKRVRGWEYRVAMRRLKRIFARRKRLMDYFLGCSNQ